MNQNQSFSGMVYLVCTLLFCLFGFTGFAQNDEVVFINDDLTQHFSFLGRLAINLTVSVVLVRLIYYPVAKRKDFLFTYILISLSIFFLCYLLSNVALDLAFALGLFAIFGIIRYRTDAIPIKEMTYLFIVIALAVMNALVTGIPLVEIGIANAFVLAITYGLEKVWLVRHESHKIVLYERIELVKAGNRDALKADLEERTGIKINRVEIGRIDFLRDTALLKIYFYEDAQEGHYEES
ncbi:MAG: DUF4956 domain-containing protein [Flavobacteriales bacterium]|nr:DUF4956 domain-containing protein [Flavobacteriales bacterium]